MASPSGMASGLQRRLLLLLLVPMFLLGAINTWFDFRAAGSAALQQDSKLLSLMPMLADSVISTGSSDMAPPVVLIAPPVEEFLAERAGVSAFAILGLNGELLVGETWLGGPLPTSLEPEFASEEFDGTTYRIVSQRVHTGAGDLVVRLADGSDPRQQWLHSVWIKVLLPNMALLLAAFFAISWAVRRALRPLMELNEAVERRSPQDLSPLDPLASPDEVRPLVLSLNRLFHLVDAQAEGQRRFIADASHQLRTPLAALQAQVEAWAQTVNGAGQADWRDRAVGAVDSGDLQGASKITIKAEQINKLRHATRRTSQLANQLLTLSRVDARSANTQPMQRIDLMHLCEVMLESHLDTATQKRIDFGLEATPVHVQGYEWLLRELVSNLVDNALKYTPPGGRVTLRCGLESRDGQAVLQPFLAVEDDGPGVPPTEHARVLERFYRVKGTQGDGNGLGLAIADEIAKAHHSCLRLEGGTRGRGLRVSLWLPI